MFILINRRPFNILNLEISEIKHLDRDMLWPLIKAFGKRSSLTAEQIDFINRCKTRKVLEIEELNYGAFA